MITKAQLLGLRNPGPAQLRASAHKKSTGCTQRARPVRTASTALLDGRS